MARIRSIKPEWKDSRDMRRLSGSGVVVWWLLITQADDEGRLHAGEEEIAAWARPWVELWEIPGQLALMRRLKMLQTYHSGGEPYIALANWSRHQRVDHPKDSVFPAPPKLSRAPRDGLANPSRGSRSRAPADRTGKDRTGPYPRAGARGSGSVEKLGDVLNRIRQEATT